MTSDDSENDFVDDELYECLLPPTSLSDQHTAKATNMKSRQGGVMATARVLNASADHAGWIWLDLAG